MYPNRNLLPQQASSFSLPSKKVGLVEYFAWQNPDVLHNLLTQKYGFPNFQRDRNVLIKMGNKAVSSFGDEFIIDLLDNHPDKEILLSISGKNQMPLTDNRYLNASGEYLNCDGGECKCGGNKNRQPQREFNNSCGCGGYVNSDGGYHNNNGSAPKTTQDSIKIEKIVSVDKLVLNIGLLALGFYTVFVIAKNIKK